MDTTVLKVFAQSARRQLVEQVAARAEQVLRIDSVEIREKEKVVATLKKQIGAASKAAVIDQVAYTWFNRFCALRYMDVNHYTRIGIVSPVEGFTQPEILQDAKQGVIDDAFQVDKQTVVGLLNGQLPSSSPQQEAYRLLLVGACNAYHGQMPFLFPAIDDYTELLMPVDLLSENSVLQGVRETLTPEACGDVEVIGWLYQFYISERKDEVFAGLKKNKKIESEDIPAATQLFTPHWIVRYLVENSLGRLWMLNHPDSKLVEGMEYYIRPEQEESDFLEVGSPEEIKVCDPACGSGHMLTYAFDLLYAIYEEQGYDPVQIPSLILEKNLYGIEIDQRAGDLAAFALVMKAQEKDRRFFSRGVEPNICVLENISFTPSELDAYKQQVGSDLFTQDLWFLLGQFEQADNFGALIRPQVERPEQMLERLEELGAFDDLLLYSTNEKVKKVLRQAEYLSPRYHVVVANPPYMGSKGMNAELKEFAKDHYPDTKSDLFAMFIERNLALGQENGAVAMITMQTWMFLSSFKKMRNEILNKYTIVSMAHLGAHAFDSVGGVVVATTAFVIENKKVLDYKGSYLRLINGNSEAKKVTAIREAIKNNECGWFFRSSSTDFKKIPGNPIAYWASDAMLRLFSEGRKITEFVNSRDGLTTGNNESFIRFHWEIQVATIGFGAMTPEQFWQFGKKYAPLIKGGSFRKWYGNLINVITYDKPSYRILATSGNKLPSREFYFRENLNWTRISSSGSFRYTPAGCIFESASLCAYSQNGDKLRIALATSNSALAIPQLDIVNPTTNLLSGYFDMIRLPENSVKYIDGISSNANTLIRQAKSDWDAYELSWDFTNNSLLQSDYRQSTLNATYQQLRTHWKKMTLQMQQLEIENNHIFIDAYGLQEELGPEVPLEEITLTCNPHYRYKGNKTNVERESLQLEDTMKEFISYAVGCMFGRYSLDEPGLILANAGETLGDYLKHVPAPSFAPDDENVIPILDEGWFDDDIVERFKRFLRVTFGDEHYQDNLAFLENAIGKDIRSYFLKNFYKEHVKMYKKRPIYWLFSSPSGSFNALIYMHRYRSDTLSVILNDYLREYRGKLKAHRTHQEAVERSPAASQGEKTKALREIDKIDKVLAELKEYEDDTLYPLASRQIEIDLDDGVKVNYNKFGVALQKVPGLSQ
jgi:type II restriction/modification system DNA methylase subunit YeeA